MLIQQSICVYVCMYAHIYMYVYITLIYKPTSCWTNTIQNNCTKCNTYFTKVSMKNALFFVNFETCVL